MCSLDNADCRTIAMALAGGKGEQLSPLLLRRVNEYLKSRRAGQINSAADHEHCHEKLEPSADNHF